MELTGIELAVMIVLLTIVFGYISISAILLRNPKWVHKKKYPKFQCAHISHRGGAAEHLENTMSAFKHAVHTGTDMIETDCQLTKDGEVVVCHDNNLLRVTGRSILISNTLYKELPLIKSSLKLDFDPSIRTDNHTDRKFVLLRDVFSEFPRVPMNIDIKENNDELIDKVLQLIGEYGREEITVVGNFREEITSKVRHRKPHIWTCCSKKQVTRIYLWYYLGLLPFIKLDDSFFEILMPSLLLRKEHNFLTNRSKFWVYLIKLVDWLMMRRSLFEHLHKRGMQVYLWVLNNEEEWDRAFKLGTTGVMTDFPTKLAKYLDNNPQHRPMPMGTHNNKVVANNNKPTA